MSFYVLAVSCLAKINKKMALFFATSPLVIIEGLVNNHNDLIAVSLGIVAVYLLVKKKNLKKSFIFLLMASGIKYISIVLFPLLLKNKKAIFFAFYFLILTLIYVNIEVGLYSWYFLNFFVFLPYIKKQYSSLMILSGFLLLSYYPYIVLGGWDKGGKVIMKEQIIIAGVIVSLIWLYRHALKKFVKSHL